MRQRSPIAVLISCICLAVFMAGCDVSTLSPAAPEFLDSQPLMRGGGGEDDGVNHLSLPVIWGDPFALDLPGSYGVERFEGTATVIDGVPWYHQRDVDNEWQAESADWSGATVDVTYLDWGDNLEAKPWTDNSVVRVEVVLRQSMGMELTGYEMLYLDGEGVSEVWGTNGVQHGTCEATVYSHCARLTIQKLDGPPDACDLSWNAQTAMWDGDASDALCNAGVWEGDEGPAAGLSAEVNVAGKIIYGYNWKLRQDGDGPGHYRLTFSLDALHGDVPLNTHFNTTEIWSFEESDRGEPAGGVPVIDHARDLSYIDIEILAGTGNANGGPGGGGGHGGGRKSNGA